MLSYQDLHKLTQVFNTFLLVICENSVYLALTMFTQANLHRGRPIFSITEDNGEKHTIPRYDRQIYFLVNWPSNAFRPPRWRVRSQARSYQTRLVVMAFLLGAQEDCWVRIVIDSLVT